MLIYVFVILHAEVIHRNRGKSLLGKMICHLCTQWSFNAHQINSKYYVLISDVSKINTNTHS